LKLYEYEAKNMLRQYGIPTPKGELAANTSQARQAVAKLKPPFAVKAQVLVAGRGKAGGILFASTAEEAETAAEILLGAQVKGIPVRKVLVEEKITAKKELYFSVTVDRANRSYVAIASATGGMEVEDAAAKAPHSIIKTPVVPHEGFSGFDAEQIAEKMGYSSNQRAQLADILKKVYHAGMDHDAELVEINPLAETPDGFTALDARLIIDDNALFRHPEYEKLFFEEEREHTQQEIEAMRSGLAYVKLAGDIGVVGNGAGLVMATLDVIQYYGGKPANFLDLGGGASVERIFTALKIVLSDPNVKVLFINILGGMTRCDNVARAITQAERQAPMSKPIVIRLVGTNEEEGKRILTEAGIRVVDSMEEAAQRTAEIARKNH
jgi:succinyl-CoA synthetase beta subunit